MFVECLDEHGALGARDLGNLVDGEDHGGDAERGLDAVRLEDVVLCLLDLLEAVDHRVLETRVGEVALRGTASDEVLLDVGELEAAAVWKEEGRRGNKEVDWLLG